VSHDATTRIADGIACRTPEPDAFSAIRAGADHVVEVTDDEVEDAMRILFSTTHNVVEGAGAAALAALLQERDKICGLTTAIVLTGANVDPQPFARILAARLRDRA
jgi:threonine dehydratase